MATVEEIVEMNAKDALAAARELEGDELDAFIEAERAGKNRTTVLEPLENRSAPGVVFFENTDTGVRFAAREGTATYDRVTSKRNQATYRKVDGLS